MISHVIHIGRGTYPHPDTAPTCEGCREKILGLVGPYDVAGEPEVICNGDPFCSEICHDQEHEFDTGRCDENND